MTLHNKQQNAPGDHTYAVASLSKDKYELHRRTNQPAKAHQVRQDGRGGQQTTQLQAILSESSCSVEQALNSTENSDVRQSERHTREARQYRARVSDAPRPGKRKRLMFGSVIFCALFAAFAASYFVVSDAVDCFKCSSRNGSNPACEDPFHNLNTTRITSPLVPESPPNVIYHTPCYAGKKGRNGLFPASACIKLVGTFDATGETLVVRHCALDSGTLTQDTELARMSHCGKFQFEGDLLRGCVLACPEDACNSARASSPTTQLGFIMLASVTLFITLAASLRSSSSLF